MKLHALFVSTALIMAIALPSQALAWGQEGHSIVAELAQHRLKPNAEAAVSQILKDGYALMSPPQTTPIGDVSLASLASWADDWRAAHSETGPWHFVDIPYDLNNGQPPGSFSYEAGRDCTPAAEPTCIIDALDMQIAVLKTVPHAGDAAAELKRWQALLFITHFVGDLSQPMHCIDRDDKGGNDLAIAYMGKRPNGSKYVFNGNLHSLWDGGLILRHVYSWGTYVSEIESSWAGLDVAATEAGTPADWTKDCYAIGVKSYQKLPAGSPLAADAAHAVQLDDTYGDLFTGDLTTQLARGGIRLAKILNEAFP